MTCSNSTRPRRPSDDGSGGRLLRWLLLGVEQVEDPLRAGDAGLKRVVHARDLGQRLIELPHVLDERLDAAQGDLAGRHLNAADNRDRDIAQVADEGRGGPDQSREELRPAAGVVDVARCARGTVPRPAPGGRMS